MYGRNDHFRRQVLQSGADSLLAAELLLDHKLNNNTERFDPTPLYELKDQIESLRAELLDLLGASQ